MASKYLSYDGLLYFWGKLKLYFALISHAHGNVTNDGKLATANAVVVTNNDKQITPDTTINVTELHYLDGVTSNIQTQINSLQTSINNMSTVYSVKGSCTYSQLIAKTDAKVGDVYNVTDAHDNVPAGTNYVCIVANTAGASSWDSLGGAVDLSAYILSSDITAITNAEIDTVVAS